MAALCYLMLIYRLSYLRQASAVMLAEVWPPHQFHHHHYHKAVYVRGRQGVLPLQERADPLRDDPEMV